MEFVMETDGHGLGTEFFKGSDDCREECVFFVEKAFVKPSESVSIIGSFNEKYSHVAGRDLCFVFGDVAVPGERLSESIYTAILLPNLPGWIDFYVSFDCVIPISQIMKLRLSAGTVKSLMDPELERRLAYLLVHTEKEGEDLCRKLQQCENMTEIILRKYLKDWVFEGYRTCKSFDVLGQGVMHLSACLGYTWAIALYRKIYFGVDYRDMTGWTALHWAAFYGRHGAVTLLLIHGANPSLLTKPTDEKPHGLTAASIASLRGHDQLAAYLADIAANPQKIRRLSTVRAKIRAD
ncbi:hypothetical protein MKW94_017008 [Papaver nudicaule]|uniref:Uncharacterized protein n=1 Tax=Papaver nudicaule TaxID=74823 RepID=A0AA42AXN5_PAPNU|nr:hypothetical protein [Papaver nudicaule]